MNLIQQSNFNSIPRQAAGLSERHSMDPVEVECNGMKIVANTGVYATSGDSELMVETASITSEQTFLEIGCGTGVVSIALAKHGFSGVAVDINALAVENAKQNTERQGVRNVACIQSDVFENVHGLFDVIVCNPPYTKHKVSDNIDRMFWDPDDEMKHVFFKDVGKFLNQNGRIYFGWANFADIDVNLPFTLAEQNGYDFVRITSKPHHRGEFNFFVLEFKRK